MAQQEVHTHSNEEHDDGAVPMPLQDSDQQYSSPTVRHPLQRPLAKLTMRLIDTYKNVNQLYYEKKAQRLRLQSRADPNRGGVHNNGYDDQNYDYIIQSSEVFAERYIIKNRIGKGSFGQVVVAFDRTTGTEVAIKIIKSRKPFMVQAQTELELLLKLQAKDPEDQYNIVRLLDQFVFRNHQCLVFEMLSFNLYDLLRNTRFRGISLNLVRKFAKQILRSLHFLARPDVDIVHCDLKPENILLKHPRRSAIKVIDFGSSCYSSKRMYSYIQSRFYRSPEVLMGLRYDQQIDIWSLGCLLVEMHTGEPLFAGVDQEDQMARIIAVLGVPPDSMIEATSDQIRNLFFEACESQDSTSDTDSPSDSASAHDSGKYAPKQSRQSRDGKPPPEPRSLDDIIGVYTHGPQARRTHEPGHTVERYSEFRDLIVRMLTFDPAERITAEEALRHPFFWTLDAKEAQEQQVAQTAVAQAEMHHQPSPMQQSSEASTYMHHSGPPTTPTATLQNWSVSGSAVTPQLLMKQAKQHAPHAESYMKSEQFPRYAEVASDKLVAGSNA